MVKRASDSCSGCAVGCNPLVDSFGRTINYLRVSVTDRCDLRCSYCMAERTRFLPKKQLLSLEELDRICTAFVERGVDKLRITGGEPLVRRNVISLFQGLSRHLRSGRLKELTLTTNASQLAKFAQRLNDLGVTRVNVSLDTLKPWRFKNITRRGDLDRVMTGIVAAQRVAMAVKINMVVLRGINDDEITDMVNWCHAGGMDLTLIETMPLGAIGFDRTDHYLPLTRVRASLEEQFTLEDIAARTGGPAHYVRVRETGGRIGFIAPLSDNFCQSCNRVRLACTGMLYLCLGQEDKIDLLDAVRGSNADELLHRLIDQTMVLKPKGHDFLAAYADKRPALARTMNHTGG